jgi:tetratricopeptide (TPR) repeat protein
MARRISRKSLKQDEFVEAAFDAGEWLEQNWKLVLVGVAAVVAVVLIVLGVFSWRAARVADANDLIAEGLTLYRDASAAEASALFEQASDKAGGAPIGDVADLYQALSRLDQAEPAEASRLLDEVARVAPNPVLAATAKANLAYALMQAGEVERAEETWRELAAAPVAYFPKDLALLRLGKLLLEQGREGEAEGVLREVVDEFPQTSSTVEAQALLDRL